MKRLSFIILTFFIVILFFIIPSTKEPKVTIRNYAFKAYHKTSAILHKNQTYKWVALGDSFTEHNSTSFLNYTNFVSKANNINCLNLGISGAGYLSHSDINCAFFQQAKKVPLNSEIVTIMGSINDVKLFHDDLIGNTESHDTTSVCGAINATIDILIDNGCKKVGIILPPFYDSLPNYDTYIDSLTCIAEKREILILDLYHDPSINRVSKYFYDGVHPNQKGHKAISKDIISFINTMKGED